MHCVNWMTPNSDLMRWVPACGWRACVCASHGGTYINLSFCDALSRGFWAQTSSSLGNGGLNFVRLRVAKAVWNLPHNSVVKNTEAETRFCALFLENEHLDYLLLTSEQVKLISFVILPLMGEQRWLPADCFNKLSLPSIGKLKWYFPEEQLCSFMAYLIVIVPTCAWIFLLKVVWYLYYKPGYYSWGIATSLATTFF